MKWINHLPLFAIFQIVLTLACLLGGMLCIALAWRRWSDNPACGGCGYDLTGVLSQRDRCPECGRAFAEVGVRAPGPQVDHRLMYAGIALGALPLVVGLAWALLDQPRPPPPPRPAASPSLIQPTNSSVGSSASQPASGDLPTPEMLGEPEP